MGILNNKQRILDTYITTFGRSELSKNEFKIAYVAFSDKFSIYEKDVISGSSDISNNVYFESVSLDSDQITFEADDSGKLLPFGKDGTLSILGGKVLSGSTSVVKTFITSSQFASLADTLLSGSIENFSKLRMIGSKDLFLDSDDFNVSQRFLSFSITDSSPLPLKSIQAINVNDIESIFQDKRLSHVPNFKFLPPINKPNSQEPKGSSLGNYVPIGQNGWSNKTILSRNFDFLQFESLLSDLKGREYESVEFVNTSRSNNLIIQFFEIKKNDMIKLDVIDFGSFPSNNSKEENPHVFFVGKVLVDNIGRHTFVNLFTLIFT